MSSDDEDEWCSDCEEEVDIDLSEDAYERVLAALHPLATAAFGPQFGIPPADGDAAQAAAAGRAPKRQRSTEPRQCCNCGVSLVEQPPRTKLVFKTGRSLELSCRRCEQRLLSKAISLGTCLFMEQPDGSKLFGMVRGFKATEYSSATLHIQHFTTCLELPPGLAPSYHILGDGGSDPDVFLLTRQHSDVLASDFAEAWGRGAADVREPCRLFFKIDGLCDYLSVPADDCPTFQSCTARSCACRGCACLNPWAAQSSSPFHSWCKPAPNPAEPEQVGEDGCRLHGVTYSPGKLAWLLPKSARREAGKEIADAQLELVRIVWLGYPVLGDSQEGSQVPLSVAEGGLMLRCERYALSSSVDGFTYRPTGELQRCGAKWLRGLADLPHRAPGSRVEEGSGGDGQGSSDSGSREGSGGSGSGVAATEPPSAAGGAADGSGGASRQRTPSGSDCSANPSWCSACSANPSWCSDGGEVSSGGEECGGSEASSGAACPSSGCGGAMQPPQAGQKGPWPIEICDLFCGAGGLSLGLLMSLGQRARVKWAVDTFHEALLTYQQCHSGAKTFEEDVCSVLAASRAGREGYPPIGCPHGKWRMLVGGPPCQGYSKANKGSAEQKARKNVLVALFVSVLFVLRWPLAIMENVSGLLSAGDTMQRIIQAGVSAGYQVRWSLLNVGCYCLAEHRRRLIVQFVRHGLPMPSFPAQTTLFPGAGGYQRGCPECLLQDRQRRAYSGVPRVWRPHVVVPDAAPLPAITARDVLDDLPREAAAPDAEARYDREAERYYAACMRGRGSRHTGDSGGRHTGGSGGASSCHVDLSAVGAPLRNHCTLGLEASTLARIELIPREGQPPPPGRQRWEGQCSVRAHPYFPPRAGNFLDLPDELLPPKLADRRDDPDAGGIYARLLWCSHFATLTTSPQLYSDTTSTILHPEADRPLTVREAARVQGFPDWVEFAGSPALGYKQVGNAVPPPLAEALGRELARALAVAEQQQGSGSHARR